MPIRIFNGSAYIITKKKPKKGDLIVLNNNMFEAGEEDESVKHYVAHKVQLDKKKFIEKRSEFFKVRHRILDLYLVNSFSGSTVHVNSVGSHFSTAGSISAILTAGNLKTVKGDAGKEMSFSLEDWDIEKYRTNLTQTIRYIYEKQS